MELFNYSCMAYNICFRTQITQINKVIWGSEPVVRTRIVFASHNASRARRTSHMELFIELSIPDCKVSVRSQKFDVIASCAISRVTDTS